MSSSMHDPESRAEEAFYRDLTNVKLVGDGSSRENPIGPEQDGAELADNQWEVLHQLVVDYHRTLLVVSGTTLYEIIPNQPDDGLSTPQRIRLNGFRRSAPNN